MIRIGIGIVVVVSEPARVEVVEESDEPGRVWGDMGDGAYFLRNAVHEQPAIHVDLWIVVGPVGSGHLSVDGSDHISVAIGGDVVEESVRLKPVELAEGPKDTADDTQHPDNLRQHSGCGCHQ